MSSFTPTKVSQMHECRKERKRRTYRKSNQRTHHTHTTKYTPKFRKYHDCTLQVSHVHRCQVSTHPTKHPEVSQCAQIQGFGLSKTTLQVSTYPIKPPKFHNTLKSKVSDYPKRPSKFLSTHEVREFLTIHPPPTTPTKHPHHTPPKHFGVSDSLQNPLPFKGKFHTLGSRPTTTRATADGR